MLQPEFMPMIEKAPLERYIAPEKPSLIGLTRAQLGDALGDIGVPEAQRKMRVQQFWHWIYFRGAPSFDAMSSVSKELRAAIAERFTLDRAEVVAEQISVDGTRKWLLRLPGDPDSGLPHDVECVYIPDTGRGTLCVSSQVGCTLNCSFCHTGTQRLVRNLTAGEIVGQLMMARDRLGDWQRKSGSPDLRCQSPRRSRAIINWPTISPAVRLRTRRWVPVWQNEQFSVQPTWLETHRVPRPVSGM